ncbi:MAG: MaoC/PaaZ C-terminal domain-containing protein, partial [Actinomycetota bacterium]
AGVPGPVVDGQMLGALMAEQVLDHFGPRAVVARLAVRYRAMVFAGDTVRVEGEVAERDEAFVRVAQRVTVDDRVVADGQTTVRL